MFARYDYKLTRLTFQVALRTNFDKPDVMKELAKRLVHVDSVLQVCFQINPFLFFKQIKGNGNGEPTIVRKICGGSISSFISIDFFPNKNVEEKNDMLETYLNKIQA